jgi:hypothetical protein
VERKKIALASEYQDYLKSMVGVQHDKALKINTHKGLPCGNEGFIRKLSDKVGRDLSFKKREPNTCIARLARDLGIRRNMIYKWREQLNTKQDSKRVVKGDATLF